MKTIKVYISLPITGQESTVMERCLKANQQIKWLFAASDTEDCGLEVVYPLGVEKIGTPEQDNTKPLSHWIGEDIKLLMECDAVYFCEGYAESRGCQLEHKCASLYQKTILNQSHTYLTTVDNISELEELVNKRKAE